MSIVVVSGHRRSGTSMMMRALHSAGLPALYDKGLQGRDSKPDAAGYAPNHPEGLFEVGYFNLLKPEFMRSLVARDVGTFAVKVTWDCLVYLPKGDWKIIFMHRSGDEIDASCRRVDKYIADQVDGDYQTDLKQRTSTLISRSKALPFSCFRPYSHDNITHVLDIMRERRDVELLSVQYQDVIDDPVKVFEYLKYTPLHRERLPLDVDKAAAVIDEKLHRVRKQCLPPKPGSGVTHQQ